MINNTKKKGDGSIMDDYIFDMRVFDRNKFSVVDKIKIRNKNEWKRFLDKFGIEHIDDK